MQDWSDNLFDEVITGALRSTVVTPQQRRRAWERLEQSIVLQQMLPAAPACQPHRVHPLRQLVNHVAHALDWGLSLLFDDTRYDRALRRRYSRVDVTLLESPLRNMLGGVAT